MSAGMTAATSSSRDTAILKYEKFTYPQTAPAAIYRVLATVRLLGADGTPDAQTPPASQTKSDTEAAARAVTG